MFLRNAILTLLIIVVILQVKSQNTVHNFNIRTITAGITLSDLTDTTSVLEAVDFLKSARAEYTDVGYTVQTIRISTQHLHQYLNGKTYTEAIPYLKKFDEIAKKDNIMFSVGNLQPPNTYDPDLAGWVVQLIKETDNISFSLSISSPELGIHNQSITAAAEIAMAVSKNSKGGEGNFRFTASANCPPGSPFFPAAFHQGSKSFAIGTESPNILREVFQKSDWKTAAGNLKKQLEQKFQPLEKMAIDLSESSGWQYDGIDTSPAPGLDASIGGAIEELTGQPFGGPSTLSACALITGVIKNLDVKTCGYSGLMLPVIEDKVLAKRAEEKRFTVQELLLFSSVSGTGLDVVPIPGNTSQETLERMYTDVASLSLKYTDKALSARLFLIPGKNAGDRVEFDNPFLTSSTVMDIE